MEWRLLDRRLRPAKNRVKFHRVREIVMNRTGHFIFPVANLRQKRLLLADDDFNAPTDDEMPELVPTSDDEAPDPETGDDEEGPSSSNAYLNGIADPRVDADALPSPYHDLGSPPTAPSPPQGGVVPAGDTRGLGLESSPGRGPIRKYKGSTRPPTIPSELWQGVSKQRQKNYSRVQGRTRCCRRYRRCRARCGARRGP